MSWVWILVEQFQVFAGPVVNDHKIIEVIGTDFINVAGVRQLGVPDIGDGGACRRYTGRHAFDAESFKAGGWKIVPSEAALALSGLKV